jgi:ornithine cyclodeaminase
VISDALKMLAGGDGILPLRTMLVLPDGQNLMGLMPSYMGSIQSVGVKIITAFPSNYGTEYDTHQGVVLLFDTQYGVLRAILDATSITAIRTAAASGAATRLLSREDAGDLAIIGAGTQAHTHLEAMLNVRNIRRVRVFSLPLEGAYEFAQRERKRHGIEVEVKENARDAVEGADIICTTTTAREPVLEGAWITPGAHINAVGAFTPTTRELDSATVVNARLYVDRRESTLHEAGEFLVPKSEGLIGDDHIVAELGHVLLGKAPARQSPSEITLFKSLGIAIEDLAAAHYVLQKARETNAGTWLEIGGYHFSNT